ncbi:hypothetical protein DFH29DRAFT_326057 [Suillus ampliporus]|nr:hypothetical protein DFH29DRAFT_326057 [Suillus ampliporus]
MAHSARTRSPTPTGRWHPSSPANTPDFLTKSQELDKLLAVGPSAPSSASLGTRSPCPTGPSPHAHPCHRPRRDSYHQVPIADRLLPLKPTNFMSLDVLRVNAEQGRVSLCRYRGTEDYRIGKEDCKEVVCSLLLAPFRGHIRSEPKDSKHIVSEYTEDIINSIDG